MAKKSVSKAKASKTTITYNPATGEKVAEFANTDLRKFPQIMERARAAQSEWAKLSYRERAKHVLRMRKYISAHADELALAVSRENGKSRTDALATEVLPISLATNWYAKNAAKVLADKPLNRSSWLFFNKKSKIVRVPWGVVGIISPWNYPLSIPFGEVVMALMAGNAVVLKVAGVTLSSGKAIEDIVASAGLPDGLFTHVVGSGSEVSTAMIQNGVGKIFFTGSVATGKTLMAECAENLVPLSLELGGKDPMIVFEDADLERAANGAAWAGYQNAGQSCGGVERIYVHHTVYDNFLEKMKAKTEAIRHGQDVDFNVEMGAVTTPSQYKTIDTQLKDALKKGAKVVATSKPTAHTKGGNFFPATLVTNVNHKMELMREETFGPILPVMKFDSEEEAIRLANDSTMGLTASVWTKNTKRAKKLAPRLQAGVVTINDHLYTHGLSETAWGGFKQSGLGRTHGAAGLEEMTQPQVVNWDLLTPPRNLWWFPFSPETYDALKAALYFSSPLSAVNWVKSSLKLSVFAIKKMFGKG
ncbi:MAG: putative succinate-semialdehyde dehydrogenase [NADP(+)] 2 [Turneriella sp.]|nr:putative succinate-semialdehyde dehydrogenase [NADP(+)] 2 [Turneriella sp.]